MGKSKSFLLSFLGSFAFLYLVHGHSQQGFVSIDCGSNFNYTDQITGINYVSDSNFIDTGMAESIPSDESKITQEEQLRNLRSFPQGRRNCYNVEVNLDAMYLIRASFLYANYDGKNSIPEFDLHFGTDFWTTVKLELVQDIKHEEIIHITTSESVQVCLINTGKGIPFISALEIRPMAPRDYIVDSESLAAFRRINIGAGSNSFTRYPDDIYDRIWSPPDPIPGWTSISTSSAVQNQDGEGYVAPSVVLSTASTVINAKVPMEFNWTHPNQSDMFDIYLYFSELKVLEANQSRLFKLDINDEDWLDEDEIQPKYLQLDVIYDNVRLSGSQTYNVKLVMSENSTLPPILNAVEIYKLMNFNKFMTERDDVDAIESIKKGYGITKDWQGDPCLPQKFAWPGLKCSNNGPNPPRITSLNLSSRGLVGYITINIRNLIKLEVLDLSNNSLSGSVPDFLARMPSLRVLNLSGNNLSGQVPTTLIEQKNKGSLFFSFGGNPNLYMEAPSKQKKNNVIIPIVATLGGVITLLVILALVYFIRRKKGPKDLITLESTSRQCSYSDIIRITNNFGRLLGEGGFGKVYYGRMGDTEVAVKMLSLSSAQGYREFKTEVDLLLRVHHKNLTSLIGYCNEGETKMGLVYEYLCRGDLRSLLLGSQEILKWEDRLQIALGSAQGLDYLHNSCRPPIIHRDIKSSNILLNENLQAKLADFGLSRAFPINGEATHVTTKAVGTLGYIDPQYYTLYKLTEKSDVYSFGVVLLELITGKPALSKTSERSHIIQLVQSNINQGDIYPVIDPKIKECNISCVWKAVDIAMSCTAFSSANRPTMSQVVNELKECLNLELNQKEGYEVDPAMSMSSTFGYESGPLAR